MSATKLVIVESPAKARTIGTYLGPDYTVKASVGHVRDLPQPSDLPATMKKGPYGRFAVNVDEGFDPYYVVNPDKKKTVSELRAALRNADELYLATDEDREGEAIAWHLLQVLKPKVPVKRMVFHEITREAIAQALENTREVDTNLVDAQETRRILDRLVGYEVSPLLWRKVRRGLSAGRVQSVATRLVVERERERMAFVPATYHDLTATFAPDAGTAFDAKLHTLDGQRFATGRDFGDDGALKARSASVRIMDRSLAEALIAAVPAGSYEVAAIESKPYRRSPAAPFTTSTLQQEAGRKLKLSSRDTMRLAQTLYENGFITYMRTDSTALSGEAIRAARAQAKELYGAEAVPERPRVYGKKAKGAQEAHEAIRPAGTHFRAPAEVASRLRGQELALYDLIWKRTVASQMEDARGTTDTVRVQGTATLAEGDHGLAGSRTLEFTASGTVITSRGFLAAYEEGRDASRYAGGEQDGRLPHLSEAQALTCTGVDEENTEHTTTPPPRYTEASLVKAMEERGIGRPSTYAATISVIIDRGYVHRRGQALVPSWLAFSVTRLLEDNLGTLVDYDFTASMERDLDRIAAGEEDRVAWLNGFWRGEGEDRPGLEGLVTGLGDIDARAVNTIALTDTVSLRVGRYGPYLEDADGKRANVPDDLAPDQLTDETIAQAFEQAAQDGRELGVDPVSGNTIIAKTGRFGPYVTEVLPEAADDTGATKKKKAAKPRTASLFASMDLATVTLDDALTLLSLPREVGVDPESGQMITALNGRYGPYITKTDGTSKDSRSLESEDQILSITLDEALALFAQPKRRGRAAAKPPLRELGVDPASEKPVVIKDGRFGPYITDGTTNVTVPRSTSPEEVTPEEAYQLLADKRAKGPAKKRTSAKKTTRKTTKKKTATKKKTTTRKTAAKKAPAKKTSAS
ncbi:type I DNA topoisomerase [Nanchangia anserum]|uniref:DNA topoisomerase 1 n=1 Tax=Nanchangia anserum TaxID=2692125 RepID=A0A8I0KW61_9ACTO|nr:type I DNA topoisomerase [Nanchangia anserum]MBD3689664.1 type I DNA topoisomerase [Nanchangia anserum]QOX81843.1 type I DNA topoisomerase [Nanchangia anserum]